MIILALRYSTHRNHERELEKKAAALSETSLSTLAERAIPMSQGSDKQSSLSPDPGMGDLIR